MRITPRVALLVLLATLVTACDQNKDGQENSQTTAVTAAPQSSSAQPSASEASVSDAAQTQVPAAEAQVTPAAEETQSSASADEATNASSAEQPHTSAEQIRAIYAGVPLQVADIADDTFDDGNAIAITFSVPLDGSSDIQSYFRVQRKDKNGYQQANGQWLLSQDAKTVYFDQVEPDSSYKVSVSTGLKAINGESLHQPASKDISFGALTPTLTFASSGNFLPLNLHSGLPVTVLNTTEANVAFHRVDPDKIQRLLDWKSSGQSERYYRMDDVRYFSSLVHEGRFTFPAERNKRRQINLPVQDIAALREPGVYLAVMTRPGMYDDSIAVTYFMVTDIGMHIRSYPNQTDVFLTHLASPAPVADAEVQVINSAGNVVFKGNTGADGHLNLRLKADWGTLLVARKGESVSVVSMSAPALDLSDYQISRRPYQKTELFIYSARDIYRPGETAIFSALLRDDDGQTFKNTQLKGRIVRPDGQKVKDINWNPQASSYYQYAYTIPADGQTGTWRFEVDNLSSGRSSYEFKVEDFMPERLKITFNNGAVAPQYFSPKDTVTVPVLGEYLYGAPAAGNRFDASVRVAQLAHPFEQWPDFYFGNAAEDKANQQFEEDQQALDSEGRLQLKLPSRWSDSATTLAVTVTGSLYESGGRPVVRRHTARILPGKNLVGIRPLFKERAQADSLAEFELVRTNVNGEKLAADRLDVRLINQNRRYYWRYNDSRGWFYETTEREVKVLTLPATIAAGNTAKVALPVNWGDYRIEVLDKDTGLIASMEFKAGESWYWDWYESANSEQGARPDKVVLALDKASYAAGDTAELRIVPPAAGETLIMVESDKLLWTDRIQVPAEGATVRIPVDASWKRHDIYITALHLQPADNQQRITPTRALGLLHLPLNREARKLNISADVPAKWLPNQKVVTEIKVSDADGQPVKQAYITLAAVDVGILSLTDFKTPDPHQWFFSPRRYQADMRDIYSRLIKLNNSNLAKQKFGGDAELSRGGKQARAEVEIVSLFSGVVSVSNGVARIPLTLPDFNGRLRLMALAFDDNRFGSFEQEVTLAAPVVTQLSMPRFVAVGDETSVALDVTNLSGEEQKLQVMLNLKGPVTALRDNTSFALTLADGKKETLLLPLRAEFPQGQIEIALQLKTASGYQLEHSWKLNSRMAHPAITRRKDQVLQPGETLSLSKEELQDWIPASVEALISANNRINLNPRSQLQDLLHYPYGCLEQSLSSTYPWIYATQTQLEDLGIRNLLTISREQALEQGMDRIVKRQMSHGGYGLWSANDQYEEHWLTAYAGDFLTDAQDNGVSVDQEVLKKTLNRLGEYVRGRGNFAERWSFSPDVYRQTYQAYAAYVLARHKRAPLAEIRRMAAALTSENTRLSLLHLSLAARLQGDMALADELLNKMKERVEKRDYYLGDYGSDVRDRAQMVRLLLQYQVDTSWAILQAQQLSDELKQRNWLSTQERNSVFMAAVQMDGLGADEWQGELVVGTNSREIRSQKTFASVKRAPDINDGLSFTNRGTQALYTSLLYQGLPAKTPVAESNGLSIERRYFTSKGEPLLPDDGALRMKVGDLVLVELMVKTDKYRRPDLLVADLLPAGLELENQNLSASVKLDEIRIDGKPVTEWRRDNRINHEEFRDDRYAAAIEAYSWSSTRLYYLARAVTPGNYQVPVPLVEDMYDAEIRGTGDTPDILTVTQP